MKCPKCQYENRKGAKFCKKCGNKLELICPSCGHPFQADSIFCDECGCDLKEPKRAPPVAYDQPQSYTPKYLADKILTTRSSIEGERKRVTVLFADVANYTAISEKLDPEEVHQMMDGCFKILMDEIHKFEGTINQFTGDGVMALFGAPVAHEDHANRACRAALAIQKNLKSYREKVGHDFGVDFVMRIGLNSGPVIVGSIGDDLRMDYTAVGDTTNLAARIQQTARPGKVFVSQETRNFIHDYFEDELIGEISLKGKTGMQSIYCVIAERKGVKTRFDAGLLQGVTELVGRQNEMESLVAQVEKANNGEAQIVDVVGEAGVGKSRLMYEFRKILGDEVNFLTGVCVQYGGNINFRPMIDVVRATLGIEEEMNEEEAGNQIHMKCRDGLASMVPFYRNLLSFKVDDPEFNNLQPEGRKFGMFEAVKNLLLAVSQEKTLVLFLEDIHWIDKISEEFFAYFSRCIQGYSILILTAYRPEITPPWAKGTYYQKLQLGALNTKASIHLVQNILGGLTLDSDLEQKILEKTSGNPFFIEEIVRELRDRREIKKAGDRYICNGPIDQLQIPATVQSVLAARMDRLNEHLKRTMQLASVIGRDFAFRILITLTELEDELKDQLKRLVGLEILYEKVLYPELEYIFKHALTQEVAYDSLLKQKRKEIHERVGQAIEELYADRVEEYYELLVHHYGCSGNAHKAIEYLILAGEKSKKNKAAHAACEFYGKVFEVAKNANVSLDPETEVRVRQGLAASNHDIGDINTAMEEYKKAIKICREEDFVAREMDILAELAWTMWFTPIKSMKDEVIYFHEEAIARAREVGNQAVESRILSVQGFYRSLLGDRYEGNEMIIDAERIASKTGNPRAISFTRFQRATSERWLGRPKDTIELTEGLIEAMRSSFNLSDTFFTISFIRGLALAEFGRIENSILTLKEGIDVGEKFGGGFHLGRLYNGLGYSYREIYHSKRAWHYNLRSEEIARQLMEQYPMSGSTAAEIVAQASVNLMENLFDQGKLEEAWNRMKPFSEESKKDDFDRARDRWEVRMDYLASQILLHRGKVGPAKRLVEKNLKITQREHSKKMEGSFLRLLGEVQIRRGELDAALNNMGQAIHILLEVGNPRKIWEAYASFASVFSKMGRLSDARHQWRMATDVINRTANDLSDQDLREGFLKAGPVLEILSEAES